MRITSLELEAIPPYGFELTVHNPAGWALAQPPRTLLEWRIWIPVELSPDKTVGLRLESLGGVEQSSARLS